MTPEGLVKKRVKELLAQYFPIRVEMPVQTGYGKKTLDFIVTYRGRTIVIETKAEKKHPTELQRQDMREYRDAGAFIFVIMGVNDPQLERLRLTLERWSMTPATPGFVYGDELALPQVIE